MASTVTDTRDDILCELAAWRLKLHKAEAAPSLDAAVLCWRKINHLLDRLHEAS